MSDEKAEGKNQLKLILYQIRRKVMPEEKVVKEEKEERTLVERRIKRKKYVKSTSYLQSLLVLPKRKIKKLLSTVISMFFIFIDPPLDKPEEKFFPNEKRENELLRRWKVKLFQVECNNQSTEVLDPFVQFIIGGDFYVTSYS